MIMISDLISEEEEEESVELTNILAARLERHGAPRAEQVGGTTCVVTQNDKATIRNAIQ